MVELSANIRVGAEPLLEFSETVSMSATVEWPVGDQVGLRFHVPFDMDMLPESRPTVAPTNWVLPAYLDPDEQGQWTTIGNVCRRSAQPGARGFMKH